MTLALFRVSLLGDEFVVNLDCVCLSRLCCLRVVGLCFDCGFVFDVWVLF